MGARGPKSVDVEQLNFAARRWAAFLFALRDGAKGTAEKWGQSLVVGIVQPKERAKTEKLLCDLQSKGYDIGWPIYPAPKVWGDLKQASTTEKMKDAIAAVMAWREREEYGSVSKDVLQTLCANPQVLQRAKRLPNYPRDAKTNDDKRVLFFAKILAGVEMGRAPLTTTRKLSHWRCENYWKTVGVQYVASFKTGLPVYPGAHKIDLQDGDIKVLNVRKHIEVVTEHYTTADSLEQVEQWYVEQLGSTFMRRSSGNQARVVYRRLTIGPCDEVFIADEDNLVWVVAMSKRKFDVEVDLARIGKAEDRRLYRKGEQ